MPWLPVRRASGARDKIAPHALADGGRDPPAALDFPRDDWNTAVGEWLIGLLQLACPPADDAHWARQLRDPPAPDALAAALAPLAAAFGLDGEGPRAFQDLEPLAGPPRSLAALLVEAPG